MLSAFCPGNAINEIPDYKDMGMKKGLIIVESPTKVRTIKRYVGNAYEVKASVGHVKDLPPKRIGVDVEHDFQPEFEIIRGKGKILKELKAAASKVEDVFLATDPDREGEAIAWHIAEELRDKGERRFHRVLFRELTGRAIKEAMAHPVQLDRNKFEAQLARRILDRLVGYEISPILWEKVKRGLSAGRVQSVAVRLVCDREREIQSFVPVEYWTVEVNLVGPDPPPFTAKVVALKGKKYAISTQEEADKAVSDLKNAQYVVSSIQKKERKRQAPPPFITSTLQQEAARKLRFSARKTMTIAQRLYEGIELGSEGPVGLITYMRTDSTRVAGEAVDEARAFVRKRYGDDYLPKGVRTFGKGKLAQDAHEAIRPTVVGKAPEEVSSFLDKDELALYELIWKRFLASQMAPALYDQTQVDIKAGLYGLRAVGTVLRFPGYTILYTEGRDEENVPEGEDTAQVPLPPLKEGDLLEMKDIIPRQHFTQPPPRYTEASLIKALEENGIGRPSTYAAILSTIRDKEYVGLEQRHFVPTELGLLVNDLLVDHFPTIIDTGFTAEMEKRLDDIEEGEKQWQGLIKDFYHPFKEALDRARKEMKSVKSAGIVTDILCERCGAPMAIRYGRGGQFLACTAYPACKNTKDYTRDSLGKVVPVPKQEVDSGETCEKCGRQMVIKKGRFGEFLACSGYPECKNTRPLSTGVPCPESGCDGVLVKKRSRTGKTFYSCSRYPACSFAVWNEPVKEKCPLCGHPFLVVQTDKKGDRVLKCPNKGCSYRSKGEADIG